MQRHFESEIENLRLSILKMGGYVESSLHEIALALQKRDTSGFKKVHEWENEVNLAHMDIDNICLNLLARQAPMAKDLRTVFSVIKMNHDIERMGDQAVNIAETGVHYLGHPELSAPVDLTDVIQKVTLMLRDVLNAFSTNNLELARDILKRDDSIDKFKHETFHQLLSFAKKNPAESEQAINMILMIRNLERLGDLTTNIAEDIIFINTGMDIRHGANQEEEA